MISTAPGRPSSRSRMRRAARRTSPAATASAIAFGSAAKQLPRDHHALDLVRALADLAQLAVTQRALDGKLARVAVAAVDLHRAIARAHAGLRRPQLGHRRLARGALPLILHPRRAAHEQAPGVELRLRVGEHELDRLVLGERAAEL